MEETIKLFEIGPLVAEAACTLTCLRAKMLTTQMITSRDWKAVADASEYMNLVPPRPSRS
jgi:hypothetical protein